MPFRYKGHRETRSLDQLLRHPKQGELFEDLSQADLASLKADIRANGLRDPIEILPDGTILDGHQRLRALRELGLEEVHVRVRADLANDPIASEQRLIENNLNRRQLHALDIARCCERERELLQSRGRSSGQEGSTRDLVAARHGLSGRTIDRLRKVLGTPPAIQQAYKRDVISQQQALAVARLDKRDQEELAADLEELLQTLSEERAKECFDLAIRSYLQPQKKAPAPKDGVIQLIRHLEQDLPGVHAQLKGHDPKHWKDKGEVLRKAKRRIVRMLKCLDGESKGPIAAAPAECRATSTDQVAHKAVESVKATSSAPHRLA